MDDSLDVPAGWRETESETRATFAHEDGSLTVEVVAGRFERDGQTERFEATMPDGPFNTERARYDASGAVESDVVGVVAGNDEKRSLFCFALDEGDALAAAVWLASVVDSERALQRALGLREGAPVPGFHAVVADDDALGAALADDPERCVFTGKRTRSHEIAIPYRYAQALSDFPTTPLGSPRVPTGVGSLVGAVSHTEWERRGLADRAFDAPLEAVDGGYRLDDDVLDIVADLPAERFAHRFPDTGPQA